MRNGENGAKNATKRWKKEERKEMKKKIGDEGEIGKKTRKRAEIGIGTEIEKDVGVGVVIDAEEVEVEAETDGGDDRGHEIEMTEGDGPGKDILHRQARGGRDPETGTGIGGEGPPARIETGLKMEPIETMHK